MRIAFLVLWATTLAACSEAPAPFEPDYEQPGPHAVGNTTVVLTDTTRNRTLRVEIWYPAGASAKAASEAGEPVENFVPEGAERETFADLLNATPESCAPRRTQSARDAVADTTEERWPVLLFSHCHNCMRFEAYTLTQRLASHGFVVVAPDHADNTLFDSLAGNAASLNDAFLEVRSGDMSFVLDAVLDGSELPDQLRGRFDPERIGVFGHSFGSVTTGRMLLDDPRPKAAVGIAAPMENPLFPSVTLAPITRPLLFILAVEDGSITEFGNIILRNNFKDANPPTWMVEVADAGHWSFSDIAGLVPEFDPGCGSGVRHVGGTLEYLPVSTGNAIAQKYITAFFYAHLLSDTKALESLGQTHASGFTKVSSRLE